MAEMATYMPVSASFIRHAGHWVDDAFGFMAGWNFFFYEAILVSFEIVALNLVLTFWRDDIPVAAVFCGCIVAYGYAVLLFQCRAILLGRSADFVQTSQYSRRSCVW